MRTEMPTFTVHQPPPKQGEADSAPERFVFVRDGFHFWAFVFAPLWLLLHRLWLALFIYVVGYALFGAGLTLLGVSGKAQMAAGLLIALLMGFEAASIRRWTLTRRRWKPLGFVVGEDAEMAERRFYAVWAERNDAPAAPPPEQKYAAPVVRGAPRPSDVIGLFPEPGNPR